MRTCATTLMAGVLLVSAVRVPAAPIAVASASASSALTAATKAVDGSGWDSMSDTVGTSYTDSWLSTAPASQWLQVNFAAASSVSSLKFWGFNEGGSMVSRSVASADLSYSSDNGATWTPIGTYSFRPATTTATYGPDIRTFAPVMATNMKFSNLVNYGNANLTGIAEVKFYGAAEGLVDNTPAKILSNGRITGVLATASTEYSGARAIDLVNSLGLTSFTDPSATHYNAYQYGPWLSSGASAVGNQWIKFDLGKPLVLRKLRIWNYQEVIARGITSMSIYTSATGNGNPLANPGDWTLRVSGQTLTPAPNGNPISGQDVSLATVLRTRYVAFANLVNGGNSLVGLDEVQFYGSELPTGTVILID